MDFHKPQDTTSAASATTKRMMMIMMRDKAAKQNTITTTTTNNNNNKTSIKLEDDQEDQNSDEVMKTSTTNTAEEKKQKRLSPTTPVTASSGRRVASGGSGGGGGVLGCQAEKCTADLTDAKRYHRRHKVCEFHAKAPSVLVAGLRQRFCQQCSRFHEISEFDETKRSCRRRLAGHNERRRKSSSELQGEGGSSSHTKGSNLQLKPGDDNGPSSFKHFSIK